MILACLIGRGVRVTAGALRARLPARAHPLADRHRGRSSRPRRRSRGSGTSSTSRRSPACSPSRLPLQVVWTAFVPLLFGVVRLIQGDFAPDYWFPVALDVSFALILGGLLVTLGWVFRSVAANVDETRARAVESYARGGRSGCRRAGAHRRRGAHARQRAGGADRRGARATRRASARSPSPWRARRSPGSRTPSRTRRRAATSRGMPRAVADEIERAARELGVRRRRVERDDRPTHAADARPRRAGARARRDAGDRERRRSTPAARGSPCRVRRQRRPGGRADRRARHRRRLRPRRRPARPARHPRVDLRARRRGRRARATIESGPRRHDRATGVAGGHARDQRPARSSSGSRLAFTAYLAARGLWWTAPVPAAARPHRHTRPVPRHDLAVHLLGATPHGRSPRRDEQRRPGVRRDPAPPCRRGRACSRSRAAFLVPSAIAVAVGAEARTAPFATWYLGGIGALMTIVMVRRRPWIAWIGIAALAVASMAWMGPLNALDLGLVGSIVWVAATQLLLLLDRSRGPRHRAARPAAARGIRVAGVADRSASASAASRCSARSRSRGPC